MFAFDHHYSLNVISVILKSHLPEVSRSPEFYSAIALRRYWAITALCSHSVMVQLQWSQYLNNSKLAQKNQNLKLVCLYQRVFHLTFFCFYYIAKVIRFTNA
jgi:hypothetical protein